MAKSDKSKEFSLQNTLAKFKNYHDSGNLKNAEIIAKQLISKQPENSDFHEDLSIISLKLGKVHDAIFHATNALKLKKDRYQSWLILAACFNHLHIYSDAIAYSQEALKIDPNSIDAKCELGAGLFGKQYFYESIEILKDLKNSANALFICSRSYDGIAKYEDALNCIKKAIKLNPDNGLYYNMMGNILYNLGKKDESNHAFLKAIKNNPDDASAYWNLVRTSKLSILNPEIIDKIKEKYIDKETDYDRKLLLGHCLAKIFDQSKIYDLAFDCWSAVNKIQKNHYNYDIKNDQSLFSKFYSSFTSQLIKINLPKNDYLKDNNITPIFIIGMPRSGTSLIEQVLSCHPKIEGLGELEYVNDSLKKDINLTNTYVLSNEERIINARQNYLENIKHRGIKKLFFTDKMPSNFRFVGWIANAFPEAKIIHINRSPMAVCFSNFTNYFPANGMSWTCDLNDLAYYYKLYKDLMDFYSSVFKERILHVNYEEFTLNQREMTETILDYCGLEFQESCLEFHKNSRAMPTASHHQVTQPLYTGSSEKWKLYAEWLKPLEDQLKANKLI